MNNNFDNFIRSKFPEFNQIVNKSNVFIRQDAIWAISFDDGISGVFGCWKTGEKYFFRNQTRNLSYSKKLKLKAEIRQKRDLAEKEILRKQEETAKRAYQIYQQAKEEGSSLYLYNKRIGQRNDKI